MGCENFNFYEPDENQLHKFNVINAKSEEDWERACVSCNDCSICRMAIHQHLITTTKHTCVYGMTEEQFRKAMMDADCSF